MHYKRVVKIFTILLISLGIISLYIIKLNTIPTSVHGDEGETALQALKIVTRSVNIFGVGWFDLPILSFAPHALGMAIFGENAVGNRMGSVIFGLLTLPVFYLLLKLLFTPRIAFFATILLGTSHMWLALSRVGITYVQATFLALITLYFLFKAIKKEHMIYFFVAGCFMGLSLYSYYAVRIIPIMILPIFIHYVKKFSLNKVLNLFIFTLGVLVIFAPQGKFFLDHPETFFSRTKSVYIFSDSGRKWTNYQKSESEIIFEQTKKTFNIFAGDNSTQYGFKGQLIDYTTLVFLCLGLFYGAKRFFSFPYSFLFLWLFLAILGQIFTTVPTPIFLPRFVISLPVLFTFVALGIEMFIQHIKGKNNHRIIAASLIITMIGSNLYTYFFIYPNQVVGDLNARAATKISYYLQSLPPSTRIIFVTPYEGYSNFGTLRFLAPESNRTDLIFNNYSQNNTVLGSSIIRNKSSVYILYPQYYFKVDELKSIFPDGRIFDIKDINGSTQFFIFKTQTF
ncbi:MAG: glycosyltransferase family 39 protein [Candidatus Levyibacteriota bacterium]|nr:MAG: glycosyltransferase family 39 protein [Candidatus Levybacteria bacterium]